MLKKHYFDGQTHDLDELLVNSIEAWVEYKDEDTTYAIMKLLK